MPIGAPRNPAPYPFAQLNDAKAARAASGDLVIDFGQGDPREPTPEFIRTALAESITDISSYPSAAGLPELRNAIANWAGRRFDVELDPATVLPTLGSKEIIHSLAAYLLEGERDTVMVPNPAYPVYERGATFHGARVYELTLDLHNGFLPDLDAIPADVWQRTALVWLNYPNNPTGFSAPLEFLQHAADLGRQHGAVVAFDEAYTELWFDRPPPSALQLPDLSNVLVLNTLSKRSCMTGYRSGYITGDPAIIGRLRTYRPSVGVTPQAFVQMASVAAWNDETHVEQLRQVWAQKRAVLMEVLHEKGCEINNDATFFLWFRAPKGESSTACAARLLDAGIVVSPGEFFGSAGAGFVRLALVPTMDECVQAAQLLRTVL